MGLRPDFRLTLGDQDLTAKIAARLLTLNVRDNSGDEADELELTLDDRDNAIEAPRRGVVLSLSLGWAGELLTPIGAFTVDECEPSGPPDLLTIRAKAADMREGAKAQRSRSFRDTTIGAIVSRIATENGLTPAVAEPLASIQIGHRDQANESDLHFLTRLGRDYGAVAAPKDGRLVFAPAGTGLSASGQTLEAVVLDRTRGDLLSWRGLSADRSSHGSVRARWRDAGAARTRRVTAGSGDPSKTLSRIYPNEAAARAAAEAELARLGRAGNGVSLTLPGRAEIFAQTPVETRGLRPELTGRWIAETVEHAVDWSTSAFVTTVEAKSVR